MIFIDIYSRAIVRFRVIRIFKCLVIKEEKWREKAKVIFVCISLQLYQVKFKLYCS